MREIHSIWRLSPLVDSALQSWKAVSAYLTSRQIRHFGFAEHNSSPNHLTSLVSYWMHYSRSICCVHGQFTRHLGYERVHLPLYKVADTPFHIQEDALVPAYRIIWGFWPKQLSGEGGGGRGGCMSAFKGGTALNQVWSMHRDKAVWSFIFTEPYYLHSAGPHYQERWPCWAWEWTHTANHDDPPTLLFIFIVDKMKVEVKGRHVQCVKGRSKSVMLIHLAFYQGCVGRAMEANLRHVEAWGQISVMKV